MGAEVLCKKFPGELSFSELKEHVKMLAEAEREEYGYNSYSGHWNNCSGVENTGKEFKSTEEAYDALGHSAEKWGPAVAGRVTGLRQWKSEDAKKNFEASKAEKIAKSKKMQSLLDNAQKLTDLIAEKGKELQLILSGVEAKVMESKKRHECEGCGCAIAIDRIRNARAVRVPDSYLLRGEIQEIINTGLPSCPVCRASVMPESARRKLSTLQEKIKALVEKYELAKKSAMETEAKLTEKDLQKATMETSTWVVVYVAPS